MESWYTKSKFAYFCVFGTFLIILKILEFFQNITYKKKNSIKLLLLLLDAIAYVNSMSVQRKKLCNINT